MTAVRMGLKVNVIRRANAVGPTSIEGSFFLVSVDAVCPCRVCSENEILREGNTSLEILRDKLKTRVSDLEEELRRLRDELEESASRKKETTTNDDEVRCN